MFPFSIRGSIKAEINQTYTPELEQAVLNRVRDRLQKEKPKSIVIENNTLCFTRGFPRLFSTSKLLEIIERGSISIEPDVQGIKVEYDICFLAYVILAAIVFTLIYIFTLLQGNILETIPQYIFLCLIIIAGNLFFSVIGFRNMLKREIRKLEKPAQV